MVLLRGSQLDQFFDLAHDMEHIVLNNDFHIKRVALKEAPQETIGFILTRYGTKPGQSFGFFNEDSIHAE